MKRHRETVRFIANHLDQVQNRRIAIEPDGLVLLAKYIDQLFALGDRRQRLVDDPKRFQRVSRRVKLSNAAVDQDQPGMGACSSCSLA